jgi:hypothetical protein
MLDILKSIISGIILKYLERSRIKLQNKLDKVEYKLRKKIGSELDPYEEDL